MIYISLKIQSKRKKQNRKKNKMNVIHHQFVIWIFFGRFFIRS